VGLGLGPALAGGGAEVFPFLRITLSGLAKSTKVLLDNLRFPWAKPAGGAFDHIVRLNVSTNGRFTEVQCIHYIISTLYCIIALHDIA
jgi:hypothetical protein